MIREVIYLGHFEVLKITYLIKKIQELKFHFNFEKRSFFNTFQTILDEIIPYCWTFIEILYSVLVNFNLGFEKFKADDLVEYI